MYNPNQIKEETLVIYQDRTIDFRIMDKDSKSDVDKFNELQHTDGLLKIKPGKKINIRLYSNTSPLTINGKTLDEVNKEYLNNNFPFVIIENSGKLSPGNVNYISFECVEVTNQLGNPVTEIKTHINILQEQALGITAGLTDWAPNTYYRIGDDIISPKNRIYNCIESHTSTEVFDETKFERQGILDEEDTKPLQDLLDSFNAEDLIDDVSPIP